MPGPAPNYCKHLCQIEEHSKYLRAWKNDPKNQNRNCHNKTFGAQTGDTEPKRPPRDPRGKHASSVSLSSNSERGRAMLSVAAVLLELGTLHVRALRVEPGGCLVDTALLGAEVGVPAPSRFRMTSSSI